MNSNPLAHEIKEMFFNLKLLLWCNKLRQFWPWEISWIAFAAASMEARANGTRGVLLVMVVSSSNSPCGGLLVAMAFMISVIFSQDLKVLQEAYGACWPGHTADELKILARQSSSNIFVLWRELWNSMGTLHPWTSPRIGNKYLQQKEVADNMDHSSLMWLHCTWIISESISSKHLGKKWFVVEENKWGSDCHELSG